MSGVVVAVLAAAAMTAGAVLVVSGLRPAHPGLAEALSRLEPASARHLSAARVEAARSVDPVEGMRWRRWRAELLTMMARLPVVRVPSADLVLLGRSVDGFVGRKLAGLLIGLAILPLMSLSSAAAGGVFPVTVPAVVSIGFAAAAFTQPDREVRRRAGAARLELRQALSSFLELVGLGRRANLGPVDAVREAAATGEGWAFIQIRAALEWAENHQLLPWDGLERLAEQARITELADVAALARDSHAGAAIFGPLQARAAALRESLLAAEKTRANEASQRMTFVGMGIAVCFLAFLLFGAISRILGT